MLRRLLTMTVLLLPSGTWAAVEVIELHNRSADEVIPLIRPLVGDQGAVTGRGFQLVVRADDATLSEVRKVLRQLDRAAQQLLITVEQGARANRTVRRYGASGRIDADEGGITIGRPSDDGQGGSGVQVEITQTDDTRDGVTRQSLRVLENHEAFIATGKSVPVAQRSRGVSSTGVVVQDSVEYKNVDTGFYVRPRVAGDQVILEISPHRASLDPAGGGKVDYQAASTTVSGLLGQWIELGGVTERTRYSESGVVHRSGDRSERYGNIRIKVELVP